MLSSLLEKTVSGVRLSPEDAVELLRSNDLAALALAAHRVCSRLHPERERTYNVERNINYTNGCMSGCKFCAFCRTEESPDHYILDRNTIHAKIAETVALGGNQILLQGGLHPTLPFSWYLDMIRDIRRSFPTVNIHGFSPTEIVFFARKFSLFREYVLIQLREAGLGSLPGGGAEILVDRVRREVSPNKASAEDWLDACRVWHHLGGHGSATMMFGHVETVEDRVEHLSKLRDLQDETGGFTAFIPWTFQPGQTQLSHLRKIGSWEYLKTLAVSRLFLDNFRNIQASWVTQGMKIGPLSLHYGANDLGSIMIEENVVAAAGTVYKTNEDELRQAITDAGYVPRRRDETYYKRSAFTLVEVMLVLVLMIVLAGLSIPLLSNSLVNYRLKKSADIVRSEWIRLRIQAMEEGQIFCFRTLLGGNRILVDRVLDVHFTASMRTDDSYFLNRNSDVAGTPGYDEEDHFYSSGFSGSQEDFILRDPSLASSETGARFLELPEGVFFADTLAVPDERAAYYLGFTVNEEERSAIHDPVANRDTRYGETRAQDGTLWSAPVFFFPDGTTSTAATLLKNQANRCLEVRLRGLTGTTSTGSITFPERYTGELNPNTTGMTQMELDALPKVKFEK
ncbi:MAG: dehypoxanthine futalosine cyclase [Planctomycetaceae bacterium]|nr:dehypoxanthine futalosine cyclase [Planctomycetaceae bacterium]